MGVNQRHAQAGAEREPAGDSRRHGAVQDCRAGGTQASDAAQADPVGARHANVKTHALRPKSVAAFPPCASPIRRGIKDSSHEIGLFKFEGRNQFSEANALSK